MVTRASDLWHYDEQFPAAWEEMLNDIEQAGANRNHVEAVKLRLQIALLTSQASVDLYIEDATAERAAAHNALLKAAAEASQAEANSANRIAKSLRNATWVLAFATGALIVATIVGGVVASG